MVKPTAEGLSKLYEHLTGRPMTPEEKSDIEQMIERKEQERKERRSAAERGSQ